jgi:hypothetical protein
VAFLISIFCSDPESHWCHHFGSLPLPLAFDESSHVKLRIRLPVVPGTETNINRLESYPL